MVLLENVIESRVVGLPHDSDCVVAGMFSFKSREFYELDADEQKTAEKPVDVKF